jgi:hypothetical protein
MEATIRITVMTIIISRSEKPSGPLAPLPSCRYVKRQIDAPSMTNPPSAEAHGVSGESNTECALPAE